MSTLSERAYEALKSCSEATFTRDFLVKKEFSTSDAQKALDELEESGVIYVDQTYVNGKNSYRLI